MLPSGTVTFLFTDIVGSTALWEMQPDRMKPALADHNRALSKTFSEYVGHVFKTVGDAYYVAFEQAEDAAAAALAAQSALGTMVDPLEIRMALHTGSARPTGSDYFGPALNRLSRLLTLANAGQILLSESPKAL